MFLVSRQFVAASLISHSSRVASQLCSSSSAMAWPCLCHVCAMSVPRLRHVCAQQFQALRPSTPSACASRRGRRFELSKAHMSSRKRAGCKKEYAQPETFLILCQTVASLEKGPLDTRSWHLHESQELRACFALAFQALLRSAPQQASGSSH